MQGYSNQKAFIIAQTPMNHTANDFWKMILDYKVSGIVTCSEDFEEKVNQLLILYVVEYDCTLLQKWLLYESCEIGQFIVKVTIESESSEVIIRHISICDIEVVYFFMLISELVFHHSVPLHLLLIFTVID